MPGPGRGGLASRPRRGSSLIEILVVTSLVAALTTASLVWFSSSSRPDADAASRASLLALAELERVAFAEGSAPLEAEALSARDPSRTYTSGLSTRSSEVSVVVSSTLVSAASLSDGGTCWLLLLELVPSATRPPVLWFAGSVPEDLPRCSAEDGPLLIQPLLGSEEGSRSDNPWPASLG